MVLKLGIEYFGQPVGLRKMHFCKFPGDADVVGPYSGTDFENYWSRDQR